MDKLIYNIFLINHIHIIEDIQNVIKNTLFSCSAVIIMPTLEEYNKHKDNMKHFIAKKGLSFLNDNDKMSINVDSRMNIYYNIGVDNMLLDFSLRTFDTDKIYIQSIVNNKITSQSIKTVIRISRYVTFTQIYPVYYFI